MFNLSNGTQEEFLALPDSAKWEAFSTMRSMANKYLTTAEVFKAKNENLMRINRERNNAERGLRPKKKHSGYRVARKFSDKDGCNVVLESPYKLSDFDYEQMKELLINDVGGFIKCNKIQLDNPDYIGRSFNFKDDSMFAESNSKTGYWEVRLVSKYNFFFLP